MPLTNPQSEGCSVVSLLKQMAERHARSEEPLLDEEQWRFFISQCYLYHLRRLRHWLASLYQDSVEAATEWTSDSVILAAAREVWFKFVREEKWTPTLRAASNPDSGLTAEQAARGYVSKTAIHDIQHLLGEKSVDYTLYEKVGRALSGLEFHRSDEGAISCWVPVEGKDWPLNPQLNLRELADSIGFVRGRSRGHQNFPDIDFPTPLQIAKLVRKVCIERRITLTRDQILEVLHGVFRVPYDRDLRTNPLNDNTDGYTGGESTFPDIKEDNAVAGEIAEKLIAEIERLDGCTIDPPHLDSDCGKFGKVLLSFVLWRKMPLRPPLKGIFGLKAFEEWSGYSHSTVEGWLKNEIAQAFQKAADGPLTNSQLVALLDYLQQRFAHRRPEIVALSSLDGEERDQNE